MLDSERSLHYKINESKMRIITVSQYKSLPYHFARQWAHTFKHARDIRRKQHNLYGIVVHNCSYFFILVRLSRQIFTKSIQFSSVAQSCLTLWDPMNRSTPGLPVHHQLPEFTQTHVHRVSDAIQPFHPLSSSSPPASNPSQYQSLFQWVNSLHEVAKVLEFQL